MRALPAALLLVLLSAFAVSTSLAAEDGDCAEASARIEALENLISADSRRLHREIAALRAQLEEPGITEIRPASQGVSRCISRTGCCRPRSASAAT